MQLIVLGMHRSGTSVLARLLNLMGAYFGPEGSSTGANAENPKGFWERRDVRNLNDQVLHAMGCDWNRVAGFDPDAIPEPVATEFERGASRLVLEMDAHRPWLLKEPRLCLLFPLWRRLLELPVCIHIHRNPVEVASSLMRRNGIPVPAGLALWEKYVRLASRASADLPSVMVSHHALMLDPVPEVARLHAELQRHGVRGLRLPEAGEIEAFVKRDLYRERQEREDLAPYASAPQVALFEALVAARSPAPAAAKPLSAKSVRVLREYEASLPPFEPPAKPPTAKAVAAADRKALEGLRGEVSGVGKRVAAAADALARLEAAAKAGADAEARSGALLRERDARLEDLAGQLAARDARLAALDGQLAERDARLEDLASQLAARDARLAALDDQGAERDARLAARDAELAALRESAAALRAEAAAATAELAAAREAARNALAEVTRQAEALGALRERSGQDIAARDREIARLTTRASEAQLRLAALADARAALEASVNARLRELGAVSGLLLETARAAGQQGKRTNG